MKRCEACRVGYTGDLAHCPLCQADLIGSATPKVLPPQEPLVRPRRRLVQLLVFLTGFALLMVVFFTFLFHWNWTIIGASLISAFIGMWCVISAVRFNIHPIRFFFRVPFVMYLCAAIWFAFTRNMVITTFVVPITALAAFLFSAGVLVIMRDEGIDRYFAYLMFNVAAGLLTLVLIPLGWVTWRLLIEICALVALVMLLSLIIFAHRSLGAAFSRSFSA